MLLHDDERVRIETLLRGIVGNRGRSSVKNCLFILTLLWVARMAEMPHVCEQNSPDLK